jgi:hypothetical protein
MLESALSVKISSCVVIFGPFANVKGMIFKTALGSPSQYSPSIQYPFSIYISHGHAQSFIGSWKIRELAILNWKDLDDPTGLAKGDILRKFAKFGIKLRFRSLYGSFTL